MTALRDRIQAAMLGPRHRRKLGGARMSEDDDWELRQEAAEERRRARRLTRCLCGYPDWPGQCPGPAACPVHGENLEREDEPQ